MPELFINLSVALSFCRTVSLHVEIVPVFRWHGTPLCCNVLFIKINNKIKCNCINSFFLIIITLKRSAFGWRVHYESARHEFESRWEFGEFFSFSNIYKTYIFVKYCKIGKLKTGWIIKIIMYFIQRKYLKMSHTISMK